MRPFEIAILITLGCDILIRMTGLRSLWRWPILLPMLGLLLVGLQLLLEGYRWQMLPAYTLAAFLAVATLLMLRDPDVLPLLSYQRGRALLSGVLALLVLTVGTFVPLVLPVPQPPTPTGIFAIGTTTRHLIDTSRNETYSENPDDPRELMVQFWYPAEPESGTGPAPYLNRVDVIGPALAQGVGLPSFLLDHLKLAQTQSISEADVVSGSESFPVIIISHGWTSIRSMHTSLAQELASQGYIVAAIDHTYGAAVTVFPDDRVIYANEEALPSDVPDDEYQLAANTLATVWAADIRFVFDHLQTLRDGDDLFRERIDIEQIGVFGHSTGGAATLEACAVDERCRVALLADGWFVPVSKAVLDNGIEQAVLFMHSTAWPKETNADVYKRFRAGHGAAATEITILGTEHYDFTDTGLLSPLAPALGLRKGPIDASRGIEIVNTYATAFFDSYLKNSPSPLLVGATEQFPEVIFGTSD